MGQLVGVTAGVVATGTRLTGGWVVGGAVTIAVRATVVEVVEGLVVDVLVVEVLVVDVLVLDVLVDDEVIGATSVLVGAWTEMVVGLSLHPTSNPTIRTKTAPGRLVTGTSSEAHTGPPFREYRSPPAAGRACPADPPSVEGD